MNNNYIDTDIVGKKLENVEYGCFESSGEVNYCKTCDLPPEIRLCSHRTLIHDSNKNEREIILKLFRLIYTHGLNCAEITVSINLDFKNSMLPLGIYIKNSPQSFLNIIYKNFYTELTEYGLKLLNVYDCSTGNLNKEGILKGSIKNDNDTLLLINFFKLIYNSFESNYIKFSVNFVGKNNHVNNKSVLVNCASHAILVLLNNISINFLDEQGLKLGILNKTNCESNFNFIEEMF